MNSWNKFNQSERQLHEAGNICLQLWVTLFDLSHNTPYFAHLIFLTWDCQLYSRVHKVPAVLCWATVETNYPFDARTNSAQHWASLSTSPRTGYLHPRELWKKLWGNYLYWRINISSSDNDIDDDYVKLISYAIPSNDSIIWRAVKWWPVKWYQSQDLDWTDM